MSLSARRRNSKWDMKEESQFLHRNMEENDWPESRYASFLDNKSCVWRSPEVSVINRPKWSTLGRGSRRDDNPDEHRGRNSNAMTRWEADNSYGSRMSPGLEDLRLQNHYRSPKNEWRRSRRSRSPSQSRSQSQTGAWSRSRSRSPVRGLRRESGDYDKNEGRSGASAQLCRNFAAGRCRRGDQCWFLHQDSQSYEDRFEGHQKNVLSKYSTRHISREYHGGTHRSTDWCEDFLEGNCRRGSNCRFLHPSDSDASGMGITNEPKRERDESRDVSLERPGEREALRASDVPCKFFAARRCRNGKNCRFFHDDWVHLGPDKRSRDGKPPLDHNANDPEKLWNGPKRSDNNISSGAANIGDDKIEKICAPELRVTSWSMDERWGHSLDEEKTHRGPLLDHKVVKIDRNETLHCKLDGLDDGVRVCEERVTENQLEDVEMSPEWSYSVRPSNHMDKGEHASIPNCETIKNLESSGIMMPPLINKISPIQQNYNPREIGVTALPSENRSVMVMMTNSHDTSANFSSAKSLSHNGPASNALPIPLLNDVGQNQLASQVSSVILTSQSMVTNEQLSQLTNRISVPLFQSLASDPASHNGLGIPTFANSDGSVKPDSAVGIQENQALGLHIQYNPWCDNVEHEKHNNPAVFPPVLGGHEIIADRKNEGLSLPLACPPTHNDNSNNFNPIGKEPNGMNHQQNKVEMGLNSESTKECLVGKLEETAEQNASLENNAADVKDDQDGKGKVERKDALDNGSLENIDEDEKDENKKSKDAKVLRPFKFALTEFVKELLKPKWKEGQMSKDSYKVIVKKVVEKVTVTMQGANIPQKQEKIEQYLSVSKPKLAKLVQAYVEKFQKEK